LNCAKHGLMSSLKPFLPTYTTLDFADMCGRFTWRPAFVLLDRNTKSFSGMNDEQSDPQGRLSTLNEYPSESIATHKTTPVERLQQTIACWFPHDYSQVARTSRTTSGEVFGHVLV